MDQMDRIHEALFYHLPCADLCHNLFILSSFSSDLQYFGMISMKNIAHLTTRLRGWI